MKPFKSGKGLANWLLRIALVAIIYHLYSNTLLTWNFTSVSFLIALGVSVLGLLLFLGGIMSKPGLTIISGLLITFVSVYKIIISFNGILDHYLYIQFLPLALGFYFFCNGNDN